MIASGPRRRTNGKSAVSSAHIVAPVLRGPAGRAADVGVVVAGHERHVRGVPTGASQRAAAANSASSETLTRSPVTAMWSGDAPACRDDRVEHVGAVDGDGACGTS